LSPQTRTLPSLMRAMTWVVPAEISTT